MKNYWLIRHKKKQFAKRLGQVNEMMRSVIVQRLIQRIGRKRWQRKNATKTP